MILPQSRLVRITFTPTIAEHFRATGELRRVARVFDPVGALPYALAALLLARLTMHAASGAEIAMEELFVLAWPIFFLLGVGIRVREGLGQALTIELSAEGIDFRHPRRAWTMPWPRVASVEETEEFFLVSGERSAFYIPKRALGDGDAATLRAALTARGVAA